MTEQSQKGLLRLFEDAEAGKFYGEIIFKIKNGEVYQIVKSQSLRLEDLND